MIQLSSVGNQGMNTNSKSTSKETDKSTAFDELLQLTSGTEKEKEEANGQLNLLDPCFQSFQIVQPPIEPPFSTIVDETIAGVHNQTDLPGIPLQLVNKEPFLSGQNKQEVLMQIGPKGVSLLQESEQKPVEQTKPLEDPNQKNLLKPINSFVFSLQPQSEQNLPQQFGTLNDYSIQPAVQGKSEEKALEKSSEPFSALLEKTKESHRQERIEDFQQTLMQPADGKSTLHKNDSIGSPVLEVPVRATHLEKDVSFVLQNAIHVQKAKDGLEATFSLQPQHLGKVDVKVSIKDGNVTAEFFASTPTGKDLLEANVQALRTALEHQGFQVDKIDISQQNANFTGPFSQKGDSQQRQGQQDSKKRNGHGGYRQEEDYRDFSTDIGWVSQINTTA